MNSSTRFAILFVVGYLAIGVGLAAWVRTTGGYQKALKSSVDMYGSQVGPENCRIFIERFAFITFSFAWPIVFAVQVVVDVAAIVRVAHWSWLSTCGTFCCFSDRVRFLLLLIAAAVYGRIRSHLEFDEKSRPTWILARVARLTPRRLAWAVWLRRRQRPPRMQSALVIRSRMALVRAQAWIYLVTLRPKHRCTYCGSRTFAGSGEFVSSEGVPLPSICSRDQCISRALEVLGSGVA